MRVFSDRFRRRIEAEERYRILEELQSREEIHHPFLASPRRLLRRYRFWFERGGELMFALVMAVMAVFMNYIVFVRIFHFRW